MTKSFLCKLGLHKWTRPKYVTNFSSNVLDYSKKCERCGKIKTWVKAKR